MTDREADFLDGVDTSFGGLVRFAPGNERLAARLAALQARATAARSAFDPHAPEAAVPALRHGSDRDPRAARRAGRAGRRRARARRARVAAGRRGQATPRPRSRWPTAWCWRRTPTTGWSTPGQSLGVTVTLVDAATPAFELAGSRARGARRAGRSSAATATPGRPPAAGRAAPASRSRCPRTRARRSPTGASCRTATVTSSLVPADESLPWSPPPVLGARAALRGRSRDERERARVLRYEGRVVGGERRHELTVVPELSVRLEPRRRGDPARRPASPPARGARRVRSYSKQPARRRRCGSRLPEGFTADPPSAPLHVRRRGRGRHRRASASRRPRRSRPGTLAMHAVATRDGRARATASRRDRLRPRRAAASSCVRRRRGSSRSTCGRRRARRSATSWARATRWPTPSASSACR